MNHVATRSSAWLFPLLTVFQRDRMVTEVNSFSNKLSFRRLVTGFPQIGNCHISPIYIVPLVLGCFPKIRY